VQLVWHERTFTELSVTELYAIVNLRERVFVVEQRCVYLDADGHDVVARHVFATTTGGARVVAYLRVLPAGTRFAEVSIGRVVVAPEVRGTGLARELIDRALAAHGGTSVRLAAQAHLEAFYASFGFRRASEVFDEDGIPHVEMLRSR
jgi:ElaA protein